MKKLLTLPAVMLCGCALTPMQLRESGTNEIFAMTQPPQIAAACVARNIEETRRDSIGGNLNLNLRAGLTPGAAELVAQVPDITLLTLLVVDFTPQAAGSSASAWYRPGMFEFAKARYRQAFSGC